jgi:ABC-type uncharacterized transport system permease subunit
MHIPNYFCKLCEFVFHDYVSYHLKFKFNFMQHSLASSIAKAINMISYL